MADNSRQPSTSVRGEHVRHPIGEPDSLASPGQASQGNFPGPGRRLNGDEPMKFVVKRGNSSKQVKVPRTQLTTTQHLKEQVQNKFSLPNPPTLEVYIPDVDEWCEVDDEVCSEWTELDPTHFMQKLRISEDTNPPQTGDMAAVGAAAGQRTQTTVPSAGQVTTDAASYTVPANATRKEREKAEAHGVLNAYKRKFPSLNTLIPKSLQTHVTRNRVSLVSKLPVTDTLLLEHLKQNDVLSSITVECIEAGNKARFEQAGDILDHVMRGSMSSYFHFCEAIIEEDYPDIVVNHLIPSGQ